MTIAYNDDLQKWLDLGESCKSYHDNCFEQIKQQHLVKPTLKLSYDLVAGDDSNKLSKKAGPDVQAAVEQRVGWPAMKAVLGNE